MVKKLQIRVILSQVSSELCNKEANIEKIKEILEQNINVDEPTLVLFPELYLTGYMIKELVFKLAESVPGPSTLKIQEILKKFPNVLVGLGMPERGDFPRGVIYNSYVFISKDGIEEIYRKRHFPTFGVFDEHRYFKPGSASVPDLILFHNFRIGAQICYDTFFPEIIRALSLIGADLVVVPSAAPTPSRPLWPKILSARAIENTVYIAYINTVGYQDDLEFFGESRLIDPIGNEVVKGKSYEEDIISVYIDLGKIIKAREIRPVQKDINYRDILLLNEAYDYHFH